MRMYDEGCDRDSKTRSALHNFANNNFIFLTTTLNW